MQTAFNRRSKVFPVLPRYTLRCTYLGREAGEGLCWDDERLSDRQITLRAVDGERGNALGKVLTERECVVRAVLADVQAYGVVTH